MSTDDKVQQAAGSHSHEPPKGARAWMRWIAGARGKPSEPQIIPPAAEKLSVHSTLLALPTLLDSSSLPNGVVELLIEDFEAPISQVLDIHDGNVTFAEPGQCVPWASIAGPPLAWAKALGQERDLAALQLSGDKQLAQRVLAAIPPPS